VSITLLEFLGAILTIIILRLFAHGNINFPIPQGSDIVYLLILSLLCTTVAFTWSIDILKYFTPFTVIITNNLEPVYGIVFSVLIFGQSELMSIPFYIGAAIILVSVFTYPLVKRKFYKN
jgi:drug/metabolite transporter (DMT)-like permease